jgi:hypothetical protein
MYILVFFMLMTTEEKAAVYEITEANPVERQTFDLLPSGIISFADFDAMTEAKKTAAQIKNDASLLKAMIENIMELEPDEGMDKAQMIVDVAQEFQSRVQNPPVEKSHLKEVYDSELKAIDEDFKGGCIHCGFSTQDELKEFSECPYCHGTLNEESNPED